jgi:hypothetical protein
MALQFEARKVALKQDRTGFMLTVAIHPDELPEELFRDFVGARYAFAVVRIQDDESPTEYDNRVKKAGMLCKAKAFQHFLDVEGEKAAVAELCKRCNIESRTELHGNVMAKNIFDRLISAYEESINDPF